MLAGLQATANIGIGSLIMEIDSILIVQAMEKKGEIAIFIL